MLPAVERFGLGFFPFFPLHNGLLTGKFTREGGPEGSRIMMQRRHVWQDAPWDALEQFQAFCDERDITMLEATFGWLLATAGALQRHRRRDQPQTRSAPTPPRRAAWTPSAADLEVIDALFPLPDDPAASSVTASPPNVVRSGRTAGERSVAATRLTAEGSTGRFD